MICLKRLLAFGCLFILLTLAACGGSTNTTGNKSNPTLEPTEPPVKVTSPDTASHTVSTSAAATPNAKSTPVTGPIVILTPTLVPGGNAQSQLVTLPDRRLAINNVSQQQGADANSMGIALVMTISNTGTQSIQNAASYYQLISSEGDVFGLQSSATPSFFGTISPQSSRSGTIVFQVPAAARNGLRLMFRTEIASETVFVRLQM